MGCVDCQWNRSGPGVIIRAEIRCGNPICARHQRLRESSFFISASLLKLNENYWLALPWRPAISLVKHQKNENALHQSEVQTQRDWHRPGNWIPVNKSSPETSSDAGRRHASNQSRQVRGMFYFVALTALDLFGVKRQFFLKKLPVKSTSRDRDPFNSCRRWRNERANQLGPTNISVTAAWAAAGCCCLKLRLRRNSISRLLIYRRALCGTRSETFQEVCTPPPTACLSKNFFFFFK